MCQRTIVRRNGEIAEEGESHALFENPQTAFTRELVETVPHIDFTPAAKAAAQI